jgi:signal transduction histidine kinase
MKIAAIKKVHIGRPNGQNRRLTNPHLWTILLLTLGLTFIYYGNLSMLDNSTIRQQWIWNWIVFEFNHGLNGIILCIPCIYAAIIFGWRGILFIWLFCMALNLPRIHFLSYNNTEFATNLILLLIPLLVVLILSLMRNWRETIRKGESEREKERQAYIGMVLKAQDDERKRISREIHDDTTQRLWLVSNQIQNMITDKSAKLSESAATKMEDIRKQVIHISDDAKRLSLALRPGILDNLGLIPALRWLVNQMNEKGSIEAEIQINGNPRQFNSDVSTHLYRITQEALNNVRQHSEATWVMVTLLFESKSARLTISDNGKGLTTEQINKLPIENKLGLLGIQERCRLLNGTLNINANSDQGTTLSVEFADQV